jgi:AAHS family benzoate transporter-like MFS transporter
VIMVVGDEPVWLIYLMLVLAGVGTHGTQSLIIGAITLYYPDSLRGTALGWALGVGRIGAVLAPQTAGLVLGAYADPADGVHPVFLLFAGAAAVATVLQFALLPVITKARQAPRVVRTQPVA